ncbi:formin-like protein 20 [Sparus aurata]|uniref:formin-like protein 20 n=1 Tax=Sparus aurata TaxID=8175 RepID=UPI0011C19EB1|nr:formin-like protein 20 [Sparus aurata]
MSEQASKEFPDTRIVISTLLPGTDTPPHVIHDINMEIKRGFAILPNIHLALHPTIGTWDLYDGLHLHKEKVKIFAKTLKDSALGRSPSNLSSTRSFRDHPRPPLLHYHPRIIPPTVRRHNSSAWTSHSPHAHHLTTVKHNQRKPPFPLLSPCPPSPLQHRQQNYAAAPAPGPPLHLQQRSYAAAPAPGPPLHLQQRSYAAAPAPGPHPHLQRQNYATVPAPGPPPHPQQQNYGTAPAVPPPATSELGYIREMLNTLI